MKDSPYHKARTENWARITDELLADFPISMSEIVRLALGAWEDIFHSRIGSHAYQIGKHIWPEPQIMGFLLHELIPLNVVAAYPGQWRRGHASNECDCEHTINDRHAFEIKTSSSKSGIFGNRSSTHISPKASKRRAGYMLAVNFTKFVPTGVRPEMSLIRFGWLDATDWIGEGSDTGQQSRLTKESRAFKLKILYELKK